MQVKMPIGIEDFKELREKKYYFVDKTDFIRQLIAGHSKVMLFTRPRRFGKTLTMSMLDYFFSMQHEKESRTLFAGLSIERAGKAYMQERGKYPVLFLSLKEIQNPEWKDWPRMLRYLRTYLADLYDKYHYLLQATEVTKRQRQQFQRLVDGVANEDEMSLALANLLQMMQQFYGRKVILLLDEYDAPIQQAWASGYYDGCIGFMRQFLGAALKTNADLDFAVLTGITRISKESIFSGLNNLDVCSLLTNKYADVFGFTPVEVEKIAQDFSQEAVLADIKHWYDGYRFGNQEIYNPWSVISFFDTGIIDNYWVNTSGNGILRSLLGHADARKIRELQGLLQGKTVSVTINEKVSYTDIQRDTNALYMMLLTTGYLTVDDIISRVRRRYTLRIPNEEIRHIYASEILDHLAEGSNEATFATLFDDLFTGEADDFATQLHQILLSFVSTYDTASKESFYHGFLLGMTALFLGDDYIIESNRESGTGRFDLAIFPRDTSKTGVILEFKVAVKEANLKAKAEEALTQIAAREYISEFQKRGIAAVWQYGIAFQGKNVYVVKEDSDKTDDKR